MFHDLHPACSDHKGTCRGDVKRMCPVPSCSDNLQNLHARVRYRRCLLTHRNCTARDFIDCFSPGTFRGQCCQKCCILCRRCLACHDFFHDTVRFLVCQISLVYNLLDGFLNHFVLLTLLSDGLPQMLIKLSRICSPCGVMTLSG